MKQLFKLSPMAAWLSGFYISSGFARFITVLVLLLCGMFGYLDLSDANYIAGHVLDVRHSDVLGGMLANISGLGTPQQVIFIPYDIANTLSVHDIAFVRGEIIPLSLHETGEFTSLLLAIEFSHLGTGGLYADIKHAITQNLPSKALIGASLVIAGVTIITGPLTGRLTFAAISGLLGSVLVILASSYLVQDGHVLLPSAVMTTVSLVAGVFFAGTAYKAALKDVHQLGVRLGAAFLGWALSVLLVQQSILPSSVSIILPTVSFFMPAYANWVLAIYLVSGYFGLDPRYSLTLMVAGVGLCLILKKANLPVSMGLIKPTVNKNGVFSLVDFLDTENRGEKI